MPLHRSYAFSLPLNGYPSHHPITLFHRHLMFHGRPLMPRLRPLLPPSPFNAFPLPFYASAVSPTPLHHPLRYLHRHLTHFICPLTPSHRL